MKKQVSASDMLGRRFFRSWVIFALLALILSAVTFYGIGWYERSRALYALEMQGRTDANLKVALLRAVLERPRAMPVLLSLDRDVKEALERPDPAKSEALSRKLADSLADTTAAVLYVVGADGIAIAASNWQEPTSFVGADYSFREYFSGAMKNGRAEHFALGNVSNRPGLYISHRVGPPSAPLGVVVVKMEFDQLENDWRDTRRPAYVVDENHVVIITSIPSWRFMTTKPLAPESLAAIRKSLQFGEAPLAALPMSEVESLAADATIIRAILPGTGFDNYLRITTPVSSTRWRFEYLLPVEMPVASALREAQLTALLGLLGIFSIAAIWLRRRQVALMTIAREQTAREELELRVAERTRDLSLARDRLQEEISDHRATEEKLQAVQQDLVQANRLAILGQVAAGVAHEINQPVATIRAYADNSRVFLERQQTTPVIENLSLIASLTERIGAITENLKTFARKGRAEAEPVELQDVFDGAVMLLRSRFTGRLDRLVIQPAPRGLKVMGNRLRLEQVFINLFQNALEAVEGQPAPRVEVSTVVSDKSVTVAVIDNGPGIAPEILASLFKPFNSSKEKGLGLGLVIAKDIVADYGGHIGVESDEKGTHFRIRLVRAAE